MVLNSAYISIAIAPTTARPLNARPISIDDIRRLGRNALLIAGSEGVQ